MRTPIFLSILFLSACCSTCPAEYWALKDQDFSQPAKDAQLALAAGDSRYLAALGMGTSIPYLSGEESLDLLNTNIQMGGSALDVIKYIDETTDVLCADDHYNLKGQATAYAREYNKTIYEFHARTQNPAEL